MKRKLLSALLAFVMVLGMIPSAMFTSFATEPATITVGGMTAPIAGQTLEDWAMANVPSITLSCGEFDEIHLFEGKVTNLAEASEAFEVNYPEYTFAEGDYTFMFVADPVEGEPTVVCPGASATSYYTNGEFGFVFVTYAVSADTITVGGFPAPQADQSVEEWWNSIPAPVTLSGGVTWMGEENMLWIEGEYDNVEDAVAALDANGPFEGTFEKGKKYTFFAVVVPDGGELPAAATVVADGASNTAYEKPSEVAAALFLTYTLGDITITGLTAPQVGQSVDAWYEDNYPVFSPDCDWGGGVWVEGAFDTYEELMSYAGDEFTGNFVSGRSYTLYLFIRSETPTLPLNATLNVPGATSAVYDYYGERGSKYYADIMIVYTVGGGAAAEITVSDIDAPTDGTTADEWYDSAPMPTFTGADVTIDDGAWFEGKLTSPAQFSDAEFASVFRNNSQYTLVLIVVGTLPTSAEVTAEGTSATGYCKIPGYDAAYIFLTYTAEGTSTTWTVVFDAGEGSGSMDSAKVNKGEGYTLPECGFTAPDGKQFKAWSVGGTEYAPGATFTPSEHTIVTAVWENAPIGPVEINISKLPALTVGDTLNDQTLEDAVTGVTADSVFYYAANLADVWEYDNSITAVTEANKDKNHYAYFYWELDGYDTIPDPEDYVVKYNGTVLPCHGYNDMSPVDSYYALYEASGKIRCIVLVNLGLPADPTYAITVVGGTASPAGNQKEGTTITLTADPAPAGKVFDRWVVTGATVADETAATTTFTMPAGAVTAEATYKTIVIYSATLGDVNFGTITSGDALPAVKAITMTNTGTGIINLPRVEIIDGEEYFELKTYSVPAQLGVGTGNSSSYGIQPKIGIGTGTFTATIQLTGTELAAPVTATVTYTVDPKPTYNVSFVGDNFTHNGADTVVKNEAYRVTLTPDSGYDIDNADIIVQVGGSTIYGWTYVDGVLTVPAEKSVGNIEISVYPDPVVTGFNVTFTGDHFTHNGAAMSTIGKDYVVTITLDSGYKLSNADIIVQVNSGGIYGWTYVDGVLTIPAAKVTGNMEISIYPKPTYFVDCDPGPYATGSVDRRTKIHGEDLTLPGAIFTRSGYTMIGWSTDGTPSASVEYKLNGTYTADEAVTLFPVWQAIPTYEVNCIGSIDYSISGQVVTVDHEIACKVGYLSGGKYVAIAAVANGNGTYSFTVPVGVTEVILVAKGDANGDANVNIVDKMTVAKSLLLSTHAAYQPLDSIQQFACDTDSNSSVNMVDKMTIAKSLLLPTHPAYQAIKW